MSESINNSIIVVTGLPRSGTTLMMRMLGIGGLSLYFDASKPLFFKNGNEEVVNYNRILIETDKTNDLQNGNSEWLNSCIGKVVKILNPVSTIIPPYYSYYFIWMDRNIKHMVRSQRKMTYRMGEKNRPDRELLLPVAKKARRDGLRIIRSLPNSHHIVIKFESLINKPKSQVVRISSFLGIDLDMESMIQLVVKRPTHCLPYMLEEKIYT